MKKKVHNIHTDTPLIPYIIAERAVWNVLEEDKRFKGLEPIVCTAIVQDLHPLLVKKAEIVYKHNEFWRKSLNSKRKDPRYTLEMFMEHWTMGILRGMTKADIIRIYGTKVIPD